MQSRIRPAAFFYNDLRPLDNDDANVDILDAGSDHTGPDLPRSEFDTTAAWTKLRRCCVPGK
jgi:hypothetical protein